MTVRWRQPTGRRGLEYQGDAHGEAELDGRISDPRLASGRESEAERLAQAHPPIQFNAQAKFMREPYSESRSGT